MIDNVQECCNRSRNKNEDCLKRNDKNVVGFDWIGCMQSNPPTKQ